MPPPRSVQRARIHPLGDTALLAELGSRLDPALNTRAIGLAAALQKRRDVRQAVAGYSSVTVHFDPELATHASLGAAIKRLAAKRPKMAVPGRLHRIPVTYDGPDLGSVAAALGMSVEELVAAHVRPIYRVLLVGGTPGMGYLGPLPDELVLTGPDMERNVRTNGAVAISGRQTVICPLPAVGPWHEIGRTAVKLFLPSSDPPALFRAGDRVKLFAR